MPNTFIATSPIVGANVDEKSTTAQYGLGQTVLGSDGSEWIYVQANGAITQYSFVEIDENFQATATVLATASFGNIGGVAQIAFADDEFGWIPRKLMGSSVRARVAASTPANTQLHTTATVGQLSNSTVSGADQVIGVVLTEAAPTVAGSHNVRAIIDYPRIGTQS